MRAALLVLDLHERGREARQLEGLVVEALLGLHRVLRAAEVQKAVHRRVPRAPHDAHALHGAALREEVPQVLLRCAALQVAHPDVPRQGVPTQPGIVVVAYARHESETSAPRVSKKSPTE